MLRREELRWPRLLIAAAAALVMPHMCPKAAGLTRTINMQPPSNVLSANPSTTPRRYNLNLGANFNISCVVTHDDCSFTADLYKDGAVLRADSLMNAELTKPRLDNCNTVEVHLVFENFQAEHDGMYYCYASTADGSEVISNEWYLYGSAFPPPNPVLVTPKHIVYYDDMNLELEAQFRGNFFEHYWRFRAADSATGVTLVPPDVTITNLGQTYTIAAGTARNQVGYYEPFLLPTSDTSRAPTVDNTVVVSNHVAPSVSFTGLQPSYPDGSTVILTCTATGFPGVSIDFKVSGVAATATKQTQTQSSLDSPFTVTRTLTLERVSTVDCEGRISCIGTNWNRVGMHSTSTPTVVQIRAAPMVTKDPPTPAATIGRSLTLTCYANDCIADSFTFKWTFNNRPVASNRVRSIGSDASQLTVHSVTADDYGSYACRATNEVAATVETFTVVAAVAASFVQILLNTPTMCSTWVANNTAQKLDDVTSSMTARLAARCGCAFQVVSNQFSCVDDNSVVYQAELHYSLPTDTSLPNAVGIISAWVMENPSIALSTESVQLQVNPSCRVEVTSFTDTTCFPTTTIPALSVGAIVGIALAIVLFAVVMAGCVLIVIAILIGVSVYCNRKLTIRLNHPRPTPVYEDCEYARGRSGDVVLQDMTKNPAYKSTREALSSVIVEDKEEGHTCEVLPFEGSEEGQRDTTQDSQEGIAEDLYDWVDQ